MTDYNPGDKVLVRAEVIAADIPEQLLVEFFSKTDQWRGWVHRDQIERGVVLDLDADALRVLRKALLRWRKWTSLVEEGEAVGQLLDQIEAQTKPDEPADGTLAKVTANTLRSASVIFAEWSRGKWRHASGEPVNFGSGGVRVIEVLIRPGIEDEP